MALRRFNLSIPLEQNHGLLILEHAPYFSSLVLMCKIHTSCVLMCTTIPSWHQLKDKEHSPQY